MAPTAEVELETSGESAAAEALLEELRERLPARGPAREWLPALLRHRVVWILAVVEPRAELCGGNIVNVRRRKQGGEALRTRVVEHLVRFVDRSHLRLAATLVRVGLPCGSPAVHTPSAHKHASGLTWTKRTKLS